MVQKEKKKKNGFFSKIPVVIGQIRRVYELTHTDDPILPWVLLSAFLAPIIVVVLAGIIFHWFWLTWVTWTLCAIIFGLFLAVYLLTKRADKVGFSRIEGKPGAAISVVNSLKRAGFEFPEQPVWIDPRTQDAIWRGIGYKGVFLLGEGDTHRVNKAMDKQETSIRNVTAGSHIPIYRVIAGTGAGKTPLKDLRKALIKSKKYQPTQHKNMLMSKIHPKKQFVLTKDELSRLKDRLNTLQRKQNYGIPKGIDPHRPQKISRRAMRGK